MNPVKLGFDDCDLSNIQKILNKETQTSKPVILSDSKSSVQVPITPVTPPPTGSDPPNKGSLTLFEFCQILQDPKCPKSVTIIKETVSQEIQKHPTKGTSDEGVANRYKYCKEVIEPYIKPYPPGCTQSDEDLIKDVLDSVHQDFPDYKPCTDNQLRPKPVDSKPSIVSKVDAVTSYDAKPSNIPMEHCKPNDKKEPSTVEQRPGCFPTDVKTASGIPDPGCEKKEEKEKKGYVKPPCPPKKKSVPHICDPTCEAECAVKKKIKKKPSVEECPPPIDYCKKQSQQSIAKKKSSSEYFGITEPIPPAKKSSATGKKAPEAAVKEDDTDSKTETLTQIKTAMEDFITKVYTTTQEAVTIIKTESARQLEMFSKSSCESESDDKSSQDSKSKEESPCQRRTAGKVIENLVDKVDSTLSKISDSMDYKKLPETFHPKSFNDASSPYDNPSPPKEIAHIIVQTSITSHTLPVPQSSSVFATIKTKICSLFCDEEKKNESESTSSSDFSRKSEKDEDDLIDRLIE